MRELEKLNDQNQLKTFSPYWCRNNSGIGGTQFPTESIKKLN